MFPEPHDPQTGIALDRVSCALDGHPILRHVSWSAPQGKTTVLFGPSGAGKTTCLRLIAGLETPTEGVIRLGERIASSPTEWIPPHRRRIGFCFQDSALWPALTVRRHLEIPLRDQGRPAPNREERIRELLQTFSLEESASRYPAQLSGGEKKRLAFARALAMRPDFLLLDEPLSSVEGPMREQLSRLLGLSMQLERTIVAVTHQMDEVFAAADRLVVLSEGRVLRTGALAEVFQDPRNRQTAALLGFRNFFSVEVQADALHTPFGVWRGNWNAQGKIIAAGLPEDFMIQKEENGTGIIESCRLAGRRFRVQVVWGAETLEALSDVPLSLGERVVLQLKHPPALLRDEGR